MGPAGAWDQGTLGSAVPASLALVLLLGLLIAICAKVERAGGGLQEAHWARIYESAVARAAAAIVRAERAGNVWLDTRAHLRRAARAYGRGRLKAALASAARAETEAVLAANQALLEEARYALAELERAGPPAGTAAGREEIRARLRAHDGAGALAMLRRLQGSRP